MRSYRIPLTTKKALISQIIAIAKNQHIPLSKTKLKKRLFKFHRNLLARVVSGRISIWKLLNLPEPPVEEQIPFPTESIPEPEVRKWWMERD